jgi:hypothetical protein
MYDAGPNRGGSGDGRPYMGANSPWSNNEPDFSSSGSGGRAGRRDGLPSGPRMR